MQDNWMYSIKNMFNLTECPEQMKGTEVEELFCQSELAEMTIEQRIKIEESIMTENVIRNSIAEQIADAREEAIAEGKAIGKAIGHAEGLAEGHAEGLAKGRIKGLEEGRRMEAMENARRLKSLGVSIEIIAQGTGLSAEDIAEL
jgi:flagellar biosynthesis/type III secretory pathway protein FliH